ncbi:MAG: 30S ribosomal protein S19 [Planctomycetes bacterium]|jgi:small subunit ribosomal protein S19|nr:30S ribosomal protein S19 [Planctomycetota bacterium]
MSRSIKKGPFINAGVHQKVLRQKQQGDRGPIRTWARASTIPPDFVGHTFEVHTGRAFHRVFVTEEMVGHKLGEFALTRTFRGHSGRKDKAK